MPVALTAPGTRPETTQRLPGDPDVWFLIVAELLTFGIFFVTYAGYRSFDVDGFNAAQLQLDRTLGVINTLLLVTSSWAVASAVRAARRNVLHEVPRYLGLAVILGLSFMVVKGIEYSAKSRAGISITTNTFFMFYYCLTIIHLLHVIGGTTILAVLWSNARRGFYHATNTRGLETGASYWHMVDLLWIVLFPLLYLLR